MKKIPEAELEVMNVLWDAECDLKTSEIADKISKDWSMSTIQALLSRLEERGFITGTKDKRLKYYRALVKEADYKKAETNRFFTKVHNSSMKSLVTSLVDSTKLSKEDIDELEEILKKGR